MADYSHKIVIAGAGIAGLAAGVYLNRRGYHNITFIEKSDRIGGRMKTEVQDGFTLDNGFHTFFTAYPYAAEILDYEKLDLKYFDSGVLIMKEGKIRKVIDPFIHPLVVLKMLFTKIATFGDKLNFIKRRVEAKQLTEDQIFEKFEVRTISILKKRRYSTHIIKNFFQPLFSSIFLENELKTSRRVFDYTFKMMVEGKIALPAKGIEAIANQLASNFSHENFIYNRAVTDFKDKKVLLDNGDMLEADIFIVATDEKSMAHILKKEQETRQHLSTTCLYFSADQKPYHEPMICVNANDPKLINSLMVLTNLYKGYAPTGAELIAVALNGLAKADDKLLESEVKEELRKLFGRIVLSWKLLKVVRIDYALPNQEFVLGKRQIVEIHPKDNVYICGDHMLYGSMNAAIKTGKMVSELIHRDFNPGHKIEKKKKFESLFQNGS